MLSIFIAFSAINCMPQILDYLVPIHYERPLEEYSKFITLMSLPNWVRKFLAWLVITFTKEQRLAKRISSLMDKNHFEVDELHQRMQKWRADFDQ